MRCPPCGLLLVQKTSAPRTWLTPLNTSPAHPPVNASRHPSRSDVHHSGPVRLATPYTVADFHRLSSAGLPAHPDHPILMSPVKHTAHGFPVSTWTHRGVLALMDRAEEKAGPEDVGEQALMRGLDTAFPFFRLGLSWSSVGRRSDDRPHNGFQEFPCRGPALTSARLMSATIPLDSGCNGGGCGPVERTHDLGGPQPPATTLRLSMCHELAIDRPNECG